MRDLNHKKLYFFFAILSSITVAVYVVCRSKTYFDFLIWNLFLAWIPFVLSSLVYLAFRQIKSRGKLLILVLLGLAWFLFFPNSAYVITDLIHLTFMKDAYIVKGHLGFGYWFDFIVIQFFSWTSLLLGAISTYQMQYIIMNLFNKMISWCFVMLTSIAGAYGILLGREYRLNSWDAITSWSNVAEIIRESLSRNSVIFCLLFGVFIGVVYVTVYSLINGNDN